ncbi:hypothetical protein [Pararhodobacter sp.]|uniref:hypothetical protein n=1 Tax=Pararhodobacter sp. TaxID=2127056 RepID=UPI002AFF6423|nr:hypothetical protein [Pararhodobacter sp.]
MSNQVFTHMQSAATDVALSAARLGFVAMGLAGCMAAPEPTTPAVPVGMPTHEQYEYANLRPSNIVPKSSPAALVTAFERFCLDGGRDVSLVSQRLRRADYVAAPRDADSEVMAFVVDDRRPMVLLSRDGRYCAVAAESRTGQTARITAMLARRFPGARPVDNRSEAAGVPVAGITVQTTGSNAGIVTLRRLAPAVSGTRLVLAILHSH